MFLFFYHKRPVSDRASTPEVLVQLYLVCAHDQRYGPQTVCISQIETLQPVHISLPFITVVVASVVL